MSRGCFKIHSLSSIFRGRDDEGGDPMNWWAIGTMSSHVLTKSSGLICVHYLCCWSCAHTAQRLTFTCALKLAISRGYWSHCMQIFILLSSGKKMTCHPCASTLICVFKIFHAWCTAHAVDVGQIQAGFSRLSKLHHDFSYEQHLR